MVLKSFKGSKHSFAKTTANELFNTIQDDITESAELFASDVYNIVKSCSFKCIAISKLTVLDGFGYDEVCKETQEQHDFWELVESYLNDIDKLN